MSIEHHYPAGRVAKTAANSIRDLKPLSKPKDPVVAFFLGLAFGALGVSIYFKSIKDFFFCLGILFGLTILMPLGGEILGWFFASFYGAWRAHTSNQNLSIS